MATAANDALSTKSHRRLPVGAHVMHDGTHFRVWAQRCRRVELVIEGNSDSSQRVLPMRSEDGGYFSVDVPGIGAGTRYGYRLDGGKQLPDPASRFQPEGPRGPSEVIDPGAFEWTDARWPGAECRGQVAYEMHVGTFTPEGTWAAAIEQLPELADLGVTVIEMMPLHEFPGKFGWGYDPMQLFAPYHGYGTPDDLRRFVDRAHQVGIGVILDVVYNHFGPGGDDIKQFSPDYFSAKHGTEWGVGINFDDQNSGPVREFYIANAGYWIDEFHMDGLRFDATQDIHDCSEEHILAAMTRRARAAAGGRRTYLVGENVKQDYTLLRPLEEGGFGYDAAWNDDFHHSARVTITGHNEAYLKDYLGRPQEFISAIKRGWLYQGQWSAFGRVRRGTLVTTVDPCRFFIYIQNHDQLANSIHGVRAHLTTDPGTYRAITALLLLAPNTPLLFQGQEFAASSPFYYFADHPPDIAQMIHQGRIAWMAERFRTARSPEVQAIFPRPADPETFKRCKLDFSERRKHAPQYALHRDLLRLRREEPVFQAQRLNGVDGAVLGDHAFVLRYFGETDVDDRLLLVNFGLDLLLSAMPEPLLAAPQQDHWKLVWSSEDLAYGGSGTPAPEKEGEWIIPGRCTMVLRPAREPHKLPKDEQCQP